jgi:hypothetical protein
MLGEDGKHGQEACGLPTCGRKRRERTRRCQREGKIIPARLAGIRIAGGTLEQQLRQHLKSFHCQEYYLNLLKFMYSHCICLPETGITLFVNQRGYVHSVLPIIICTVVVVVDIAARQQRF